MRLSEIAQKLGLDFVEGTEADTEITGGYASDLMSDVIAHADAGDLWVTLQVHENVVAIASMKEIAAIIIFDQIPAEATRKRVLLENFREFN